MGRSENEERSAVRGTADLFETLICTFLRATTFER